MSPHTTPRTWTTSEQAINRRHVANGLLSGRCAQGTGRLWAGDCGCWGGVACLSLNEAHPGLIRVESLPASEGFVPGQLAFDDEWAALPDSAVAALGLADEYGSYAADDGEASLIDDNDRGMAFPQIAALLLNPPPGLLATPAAPTTTDAA